MGLRAPRSVPSRHGRVPETGRWHGCERLVGRRRQPHCVLTRCQGPRGDQPGERHGGHDDNDGHASGHLLRYFNRWARRGGVRRHRRGGGFDRRGPRPPRLQYGARDRRRDAPAPMRRPILFAVGAALAAPPGRSQATLHLSVPASTPTTAAIFVAGTFNQWNPGASAFRLAPQGGGTYAITLPPSVRGPIEFKFTLGSWDVVEQDSAGRDVPNRAFTVPTAGTASYAATVARWRDGSPRPLAPASATASVSVLSDSFAMPQLGRRRRVWLYLPPGYARSQQRYPVLYLQDGQNVFDARTSFAGEWGVDETLDSLRALGDAGVIVVAVDNGQQRRFDEYSPWPNPQYGGGQGDGYVEFLVQTLKPYIDQHYRTLPDRFHTGIAGSSMGGLISLYAALKYPDVFGRVGVFSPAFWVAPS